MLITVTTITNLFVLLLFYWIYGLFGFESVTSDLVSTCIFAAIVSYGMSFFPRNQKARCIDGLAWCIVGAGLAVGSVVMAN